MATQKGPYEDYSPSKKDSTGFHLSLGESTGFHVSLGQDILASSGKDSVIGKRIVPYEL